MTLSAFACAFSAFVAPHSRLHGARGGVVSMGTTSDFKNGLTLEVDGSVWKITDFLHVKPGKGPAFVRSTLKNLETGKTLDKTWKAGEAFQDATIEKQECQVSDGRGLALLRPPARCERRPRCPLAPLAVFVRRW